MIQGTWPACRFWNLCLWNPYLWFRWFLPAHTPAPPTIAVVKIRDL